MQCFKNTRKKLTTVQPFCLHLGLEMLLTLRMLQIELLIDCT